MSKALLSLPNAVGGCSVCVIQRWFVVRQTVVDTTKYDSVDACLVQPVSCYTQQLPNLFDSAICWQALLTI